MNDATSCRERILTHEYIMLCRLSEGIDALTNHNDSWMLLACNCFSSLLLAFPSVQLLFFTFASVI